MVIPIQPIIKDCFKVQIQLAKGEIKEIRAILNGLNHLKNKRLGYTKKECKNQGIVRIGSFTKKRGIEKAHRVKEGLKRLQVKTLNLSLYEQKIIRLAERIKKDLFTIRNANEGEHKEEDIIAHKESDIIGYALKIKETLTQIAKVMKDIVEVDLEKITLDEKKQIKDVQVAKQLRTNITNLCGLLEEAKLKLVSLYELERDVQKLFKKYAKIYLK